MSEKYVICAQDRTAHGHSHVFRAGRGWVGGVDTVIEVLNQTHDPMIPGKNGTDVPDPLVLGQDSWAKLKADKRISWRPFGMVGPGQAMDKVVELTTETKALKDKIYDLEKALAASQEEADYASSLLKENEALNDKVVELTATLESLTAPAPKAEPESPKVEETPATKSEDLPKAKSKTVK